jgi:hypothetical protein
MVIFARNKATSDDNIVSILECVEENLSEVEFSDSDNEIGDDEESDCKCRSDNEQSDGQASPAVNAWSDVKWQIKI